MPAMTLNFEPLNTSNLAADITRQIRAMIETGALNPGDQLPSTRVLANELQTARGTVVTALETLAAEGFLETRRGAGTFVAQGCRAPAAAVATDRTPPEGRRIMRPDIDPVFTGTINFQGCRPSLEAFPQMAWRRANADAASRLPNPDYGDPRGELELRIAIASYLCRARGLDVNPDELIVTNGALAAMHILANLYLSAGDAVAFEDPGYPLARQTFEMVGATIHNLDVDDDGLCVDQLPEEGGNIRLIYVTPSHQFPTGQRLSLERRRQLIEWASAHDALILEDDYDGEFRYDIAPLPPMAAMTSNGHVIYFGTFSKTLFPSLRIGFAAGPKSLIEAMARYRTMTDYQTNVQTQLALAAFINSGQFERHIHRMRRIYASKRKCLKDAIASTELAGELTGTDSGLNALVRLRCDLSAANISQRALLSGISAPPISRYARSAAIADNALVLGYSALGEQAIRSGVGTLRNIIDDAMQ